MHRCAEGEKHILVTGQGKLLQLRRFGFHVLTTAYRLRPLVPSS